MGCESRQVGVHEQLVLGLRRMGDDGVDGVGRDQPEYVGDLRHVQGHGLIQWLRQHVRQDRRLHRLGPSPAQPAPPPG